MSDLLMRTEMVDKQLTMIWFSGLFEGLSAMNSQDELEAIFEKTQTPNLWIDLSEIKYIDSSAIGVLINLARVAVKRKIKFSIRNPNVYIKKILSVTRADTLIPIVEA